MELRVNEVQIPAEITFNYDELKAELAEKVNVYTTMVYTDEQIKDAKADKANLNKLKKALNDERIRREREYMKPFNVFKDQVNEIITIIDKPIAVIDKQVKEYDIKRRDEKKQQIIDFYNSLEDKPVWLELERIASAKWLNASTSLKSVQDEITGKLDEIKADIETLKALPEFGFEACEYFKHTLDMHSAINEAKRLAEIEKRKAEMERLKQEAEEKARLEAEQAVEVKAEEVQEPQQTEQPQETQQQQEPAPNFMNPPVEPSMWINFSAKLTKEQAFELKEFFEKRNIEFKPI